MEYAERLPGRPLRNWGGWLVALLAVAMFSCALLAWPIQVWLPHSRLPPGFTAHLCVGKLTSLYTQFGFWWTSSYNYYNAPLPVAASPYTSSFCGFVPWAPALPQLGRFLFPP